MGLDGWFGDTANINYYFAQDVAGYSLGYREGDYHPIDKTGRWNVPADRFLSDVSGSDLLAARSDLYNGNIGWMVTSITPPADTGISLRPLGMAYRYDQLNRLKEAKGYENFDATNNRWQSGSTYNNMYKNSFVYDANGNIKRQSRWDKQGNQVDSLEYHYFTDNLSGPGKLLQNRLYHVNEDIASGNYADDIDDMGTLTTTGSHNFKHHNNYSYTDIGELEKDSAEEILNIDWRVDGKISSITRYPGSTKKNLKFDYDAMGNRVAKHSYDSHDNWERSTYYWRDAQGNVLAVYDRDFNDSLEMMSHRLTERHIYGSSRMGMDVTEVEMIGATDPDTTATQRALQYKQYEISNHLGNVLAVVTDMKVPVVDVNDSVQGYLADILTAQDYSPFGVLLYDRTFRSGEYRCGFNGQEKDDEVYGPGNLNTARFWAYDTRLGRRWNIDPKFKSFPEVSPYSVFFDNPIYFNDPNGDCPVCWVLLGLLTLPSSSVAPTGSGRDAAAMEEARDLQARWLLYTVGGGGLATGAISRTAFMKSVAAQFSVQALGNTFTDYIDGGGVDFQKVLVESFKNIDLADAFISQIKASDLVKNILTATIDLTPEEAEALGLDKSTSVATIDFIVNTIGAKLGEQMPRGKYSSLVEKVQGVIEEKTGEFIKETLETPPPTEMIEGGEPVQDNLVPIITIPQDVDQQ